MLVAAHPWVLLPQPSPLAAEIADVLPAAAPDSETDMQRQQAHHWAMRMTCAAAGYYAFRLWLLSRSRASQAWGRLALVQYTMLLLVYGVASFKDVQVLLLAAVLMCELAGVPAAASKVLDLTGASSGGALRKGLSLLEQLLFPAFR